jgi:hypothetical protein
MARRHAVRYRDRLLIAAALAIGLAHGGAGARAGSLPATAGPLPAALPLGQVSTVRTEQGGLAQFTLLGPFEAGVLSLGLRPAPGSVLVVEGDEPLDPTERTVKGDLLAMSLKIKGTGGIWVMSGPTPGRDLQIFAVLDPAGPEPAGPPAPQGFPSDNVLDALSRLAGSPSPSWFSPTRLGPWLVPRRQDDVPALPGCAEHVTGAGLRTCARESLSAIWNCLAHREMSTRAISSALALYLDDRLAFTAAQAADAGDCAKVASLAPDDASRERARAVIATAFSGQGSEGGQAATAGGAVAPPAKGTDREMGPSREAEILALIKTLEDSCAGRSLLEALRDPEDTGIDTKVSLMTHELARSVEGWTGRLPDESDDALLEAARALQGLPRGAGCNPVVALMALSDEWAAREAEGTSTNGVSERFIAAFRDARKEQGDDLNRWLRDRFPLLYRDAKKILLYLE